MRLVQFLKNGLPALGIETKRGVIDAAATDPYAPSTMAGACRVGADVLPLLSEIAKNEAMIEKQLGKTNDLFRKMNEEWANP